MSDPRLLSEETRAKIRADHRLAMPDVLLDCIDALDEDCQQLIDASDGKWDVIDKQADTIQVLTEQIRAFYDVLKHGDEEHQRWLRDMVNEHFGLED